MKYLIPSLFFILTPTSYSQTLLPTADFSKLSYTDRIVTYFSGSPIKSYTTGELESLFTYSQNNDYTFKNLQKELSTFSKKNLNYKPSKGLVTDITPMVQEAFSRLDFKKVSTVNSYNCHNTTLVLNGFLKYQSYSTQDEITFYFNNFCEEVNEEDTGTIGMNFNRITSHSYTRISKNLIFHKPSNGMKSRYLLQNALERYNNFRYFKCDTQKFNKLRCPDLEQLQQRLDQVDKFFSILSSSLSNASNRFNQKEKLDQITHDLEKLHIQTQDCELIKEAMIQRIEAITSLYEDLNAGNIYGHGSYGGLGPKI